MAGINTAVAPGETVPIALTISGSGATELEFVASDNIGLTTRQTFVVVTYAPERIDQVFSAVWSGMNDALLSGDKDAAMTYLSPAAQEKYSPVFDALMPIYPEVIANWSPPLRGNVSPELAEYGVVDETAGGRKLFLIYMVRGLNGVWRLEAM